MIGPSTAGLAVLMIDTLNTVLSLVQTLGNLRKIYIFQFVCL